MDKREVKSIHSPKGGKNGGMPKGGIGIPAPGALAAKTKKKKIVYVFTYAVIISLAAYNNNYIILYLI